MKKDLQKIFEIFQKQGCIPFLMVMVFCFVSMSLVFLEKLFFLNDIQLN